MKDKNVIYYISIAILLFLVLYAFNRVITYQNRFEDDQMKLRNELFDLEKEKEKQEMLDFNNSLEICGTFSEYDNIDEIIDKQNCRLDNQHQEELQEKLEKNKKQLKDKYVEKWGVKILDGIE